MSVPGEGPGTSPASGDERPPVAPVAGPAPDRAWLWVGAVALLVRAAYLVEHLGSAFFGVPILDEAFYDAAARAILAGEDLGSLNPGFRPLLYPLFLALAYLLAVLLYAWQASRRASPTIFSDEIATTTRRP